MPEPVQIKRTLLWWSTGKDSAWALHRLRTQPGIVVEGLVTTVNRAFGRVAMHAVRRALLEQQARAAGLPLAVVEIPYPCSNADYEAATQAFIEEALASGITHMAFGDLFLEDVRAYREDLLAGTGITPLFPLWGLPTQGLAAEMVASGVRAVVTCVDPRQLAPAFAGRTFDAAFLADLPEGIDPCGERGEFHTFAFEGPMFVTSLLVRTGELVERDGFIFADVLLVDSP